MPKLAFVVFRDPSDPREPQGFAPAAFDVQVVQCSGNVRDPHASNGRGEAVYAAEVTLDQYLPPHCEGALSTLLKQAFLAGREFEQDRRQTRR